MKGPDETPRVLRLVQPWAERALHVALVFAAAWIAANPKYAWAIPALQALGQGLPQPR